MILGTIGHSTILGTIGHSTILGTMGNYIARSLVLKVQTAYRCVEARVGVLNFFFVSAYMHSQFFINWGAFYVYWIVTD